MTNPTVIRALQDRAAAAQAWIALADDIDAAAEVVIEALRHGHKLLVFGNGGSAADAQHLSAELVGRFLVERRPLPAIALTTDTSILTAVGNDYGYQQVFARQVTALGQPGDVAVALSTSGRSPNVLAALTAAQAGGLRTIGFTGATGGPLAEMVDVAIVVPSPVTSLIQEGHQAVSHIICELVDQALATP